MGFRFRRSIRIAPGLRVNLGKTGLSLSAGVRGASVTVGPKGAYGNVGLPGTGISYRSKLGGSSSRSRAAAEARHTEKYIESARRDEVVRSVLKKITLHLSDDGVIQALDEHHNPLNPEFVKAVWQQKSDAVREWLKAEADRINGDIDLLANIFHDTPAPNSQPTYSMVPFSEIEPQKPQRLVLSTLGFFRRMFKSQRDSHAELQARLDKEFHAELQHWETNHAHWTSRKNSHDSKERQLQDTFPDRIRSDVPLMEEMLERALDQLSWPRETTIAIEIRELGHAAWLDADLPEIENLPQRTAQLAASGRKLNIKAKAQKQLRKEYATHVHGIALRIAGVTFATLPAVERAIVSGYTQRVNNAHGNTEDQYLYSVRIERQAYSKLNFDALENVDPIAAFDLFEYVRSMNANLEFRPIQPYPSKSAEAS